MSYNSQYSRELQRLEQGGQQTRSLVTDDIEGARPKQQFRQLKNPQLHYSLDIGKRTYNMRATKNMRNPQFTNFYYQPGSYGGKDHMEDTLDKVRQDYRLDYNIGAPTYNDYRLKKNQERFYGVSNRNSKRQTPYYGQNGYLQPPREQRGMSRDSMNEFIRSMRQPIRPASKSVEPVGRQKQPNNHRAQQPQQHSMNRPPPQQHHQPPQNQQHQKIEQNNLNKKNRNYIDSRQQNHANNYQQEQHQNRAPPQQLPPSRRQNQQQPPSRSRQNQQQKQPPGSRNSRNSRNSLNSRNSRYSQRRQAYLARNPHYLPHKNPQQYDPPQVRIKNTPQYMNGRTMYTHNQEQDFKRKAVRDHFYNPPVQERRTIRDNRVERLPVKQEITQPPNYDYEPVDRGYREVNQRINAQQQRTYTKETHPRGRGVMEAQGGYDYEMEDRRMRSQQKKMLNQSAINQQIRNRRQNDLNSYQQNVKMADYGQQVSNEEKHLKNSVIPVHSIYKLHSHNRRRSPTYNTSFQLHTGITPKLHQEAPGYIRGGGIV